MNCGEYLKDVAVNTIFESSEHMCVETSSKTQKILNCIQMLKKEVSDEDSDYKKQTPTPPPPPPMPSFLPKQPLKSSQKIRKSECEKKSELTIPKQSLHDKLQSELSSVLK